MGDDKAWIGLLQGDLDPLKAFLAKDEQLSPDIREQLISMISGDADYQLQTKKTVHSNGFEVWERTRFSAKVALSLIEAGIEKNGAYHAACKQVAEQYELSPRQAGRHWEKYKETKNIQVLVSWAKSGKIIL